MNSSLLFYINYLILKKRKYQRLKIMKKKKDLKHLKKKNNKKNSNKLKYIIINKIKKKINFQT